MVKVKPTYSFNSKSLGGIYEVYVDRIEYSNRRVGLLIVDAEDDIPLLTATIDISEEDIKQHEVIIKHDAKNDGVLRFLIENKIVSMPRRYTKIVGANNKAYPICELF